MIRSSFMMLLLLSFVFPVQATLKIAVASNFKVTLTELVALYASKSKQRIIISSGSTGTLYNQIQQGAPYDLFLSADSERVRLIENSKFGVTGPRFTYAQGRLAFWQPSNDGKISVQSLAAFKGKLAIANPKLAPYGLAALQSLQYLSLWEQFSYVQGNNVAQTYQFIDTGNIGGGFVAHSLLLQNNEKNYFLLPTNSYQPILQQGVILSNSANKQATQDFVDFLMSAQTQTLIRSKGYL